MKIFFIFLPVLALFLGGCQLQGPAIDYETIPATNNPRYLQDPEVDESVYETDYSYF